LRYSDIKKAGPQYFLENYFKFKKQTQKKLRKNINENTINEVSLNKKVINTWLILYPKKIERVITFLTKDLNIEMLKSLLDDDNYMAAHNSIENAISLIELML